MYGYLGTFLVSLAFLPAVALAGAGWAGCGGGPETRSGPATGSATGTATGTGTGTGTGRTTGDIPPGSIILPPGTNLSPTTINFINEAQKQAPQQQTATKQDTQQKTGGSYGGNSDGGGSSSSASSSGAGAAGAGGATASAPALQTAPGAMAPSPLKDFGLVTAGPNKNPDPHFDAPLVTPPVVPTLVAVGGPAASTSSASSGVPLSGPMPGPSSGGHHAGAVASAAQSRGLAGRASTGAASSRLLANGQRDRASGPREKGSLNLAIAEGSTRQTADQVWLQQRQVSIARQRAQAARRRAIGQAVDPESEETAAPTGHRNN